MANKGFTLLEVLVMACILLIGIVAGAQLMVHSLKQAQAANEKTLAMILAASQMAQLQAIPIEQLPDWISKNARKQANQSEQDKASCFGWVSSVESVSGSDKTYRVTIHLLMESGQIETFTTIITDK